MKSLNQKRIEARARRMLDVATYNTLLLEAQKREDKHEAEILISKMYRAKLDIENLDNKIRY